MKYDVIILGGGYAGLTLGLQLRQQESNLSILILEKRAEDAPVAGHKVGESISELGSHYLREVLNLKDYLDTRQLPKLGFRFFFPSEQQDDISQRVEVGTILPNTVPAHQIDRGILENELVSKLKHLGVEIILGARVNDIQLSKAGHQIYFEKDNKTRHTQTNWVVDSTGRNGILKRKLRLKKEVGHHTNAAWFRLKGKIDVDNWSEEKNWKNYIEPGKRRLATNHFTGEGYWIWIIPLVSGNTSIGIVSDPNYNKFEEFNSFENVIKWLKRKEPLIAEKLKSAEEKLIDFKNLEQLAHDSKQFYNADKWGVTGNASAFLDPFYSSGMDFIALNNSWLTDLITRDFRKENIALRSLIYQHAHRQILDGWLLLYQNMYGLFGKTQVMLFKIVWDWSTYWGIPCTMFNSGGYTDLASIKKYSAGRGNRFSELNERMQALFRYWGTVETQTYSNRRINIFDIDYLLRFYKELNVQYSSEALMPRIESNLDILEQVAAEIFSFVSRRTKGTPANMPVNPYKMDIRDSKEDLIEKSKIIQAITPSQAIKNDLRKVRLEDKPVNLVEEKMDYIQNLFLKVRKYFEQHPSLEQLAVYLESEPPEYRSIAFESASMEVGLIDLNRDNGLTEWKKFYQNAEELHAFHMEIGLGWAFAKTGKLPNSEDDFISPKMRQLILDGIGYYYGLFKGRKTILKRIIPEHISKEDLKGFDQGIGRRLWYMAKGKPKAVFDMIQKFPKERHADLWRGVGIACGYVGSNSLANLERLFAYSKNHKTELKKGINLAAQTRKNQENIIVDI